MPIMHFMNALGIMGRTPRSLAEHSLVRLLADLPTRDGTVPKGTLATVVQVFKNGAAYQVEFEGEHDCPETVPATAIEPVHVRTA